MKFKFNINITQEDYIEFNKAIISETPMGKKLSKIEKIFFATLFCVLILIVLTKNDFSDKGFSMAFCLIIAFVIVLFLTKPINNIANKISVKSLTKIKGKLPYSENSVLEFYDDVFVEITDDNKNEIKYSAIENVFVNENLVVLFINSAQAYILPIRSFESNEQKNSLVEFLNGKIQK